MKRFIISVILAISLVVVPASGALALTSQNVTITATPSYLSISNDPATWVMGNVSESTVYWSNDVEPVTTVNGTTDCNYTVTNDGSVTANISITGNNFTGGTPWTLAASTGSNQVILKAAIDGAAVEAGFVTLLDGAENLAFVSSLAGSGTTKWLLKLETGTFADTAAKSGTVTLTATAA